MRKLLCIAFAAITWAGSSRAGETVPVFIFTGDPTPVPEERRRELEESRAKWVAAKSDSGGNYSYQVTVSSFSGFRSTTTITVTRGIVSKRAYEEFIPQFFDFEPRNYLEEGDDIGERPYGAAPLTVDELYEIAKEVLETPLQPYEQLVLGFDDQGLLNSCFTYNVLIADDRPINGVSIYNLTLLPRFSGSSDSDSDSEFDEDHSQETVRAIANRAPFLRVEIKRLKLALRDAKRIKDSRRKREVIKRIKRLIRKRLRALR